MDIQAKKNNVSKEKQIKRSIKWKAEKDTKKQGNKKDMDRLAKKGRIMFIYRIK